jgi:streptogramin lyase
MGRSGRVVTNEFPIPTPNSGAYGITAGPDGALWFIENKANKIGRITTVGVVTNPTFSTGGLNRRFWGVAEARKRVGSKGRVLESSVV